MKKANIPSTELKPPVNKYQAIRKVFVMLDIREFLA